ncbi:MAG: hypothetical protein R3E39_13605 [Anaerolineae bacterium]
MERVAVDLQLVRMIQRSKDIDSGLPLWARRSNPIVRRELGRSWRTMLPEITFLRQAFVVQAILIVLTLPFPFLIALTLPTVTASILLFPFAIYVYGRLLFLTGATAARSITSELENYTLPLLRSSPYSTYEIIASKAAASIWRQVEDLGLLLIAAALLSTPLLISQYGSLWPLDQHPYLSRTAMILGLAVSMLRLALEPFMVAMLGIAMGAALKTRPAAVMGTVSVAGFYFLCVNLTRFIPMSWPLRFVVDFFIPLAVPLLVTALSFRLTQYLLEEHQ